MKSILKAAVILLGLVVLLVLLVSAYVLTVWDSPETRPAPTLSGSRDSAAIARGRYLYSTTWQCGECHQSEGAAAGSPPSGGRVFDLREIGPGFGIYYSRNITPDSSTGIGLWTDGEILQAIREGIGKDRRLLFPIMPTDWLKDISDADGLAIVAYLRSLPPVHNPVSDREPSFAAKALITFGAIAPGPAIERPIVAPPVGTTVEYGQYLATAASGCADCHTPRNLQDGKFYLDSLFAGSSFPFGFDEGSPLPAYARNITPLVGSGIGGWTEEQFIGAVTGGMRPDGTVLSPHMPYAHYKQLTADDLRALYLYLTSIPAIQRATPPPTYSAEVRAAVGAERGKLLYAARCQACHGSKGMGEHVTSGRLAALMPFYSDQDFKEFVSAGQPALKMPGFGKTLSGRDLDDLLAYIRTWEPPPDP